MADDSVKNDIKSVSIQQYKSDIGFRTLVESVNENLYIIPKYQRKYRWTKTQVNDLVESLIRGLPIPPIYTYRNEENQLEILDGQQRVMSLFFYYIGKYMNKRKNSSINFSALETDGKTFKEALLEQYELEELDSFISGKEGKKVDVRYAALPIELKRQVDYTTITIVEIKVDDEERRAATLRQIFANLNRGGSLLSEQEQRNGIYVCRFYDMLQEYNRNNTYWRNIWGREDAKEKDMEALLRFCALKRYVSVRYTKNEDFDFTVEGYRSSYVELLDRFSEEAMKYSDEEIQQYKKSLDGFLNLFELNRKQVFGIALLESFFVVYDKLNLEKPITMQLYDTIFNDGKISLYARQGTVKMKNMNERWKTVYEIWNAADTEID